VCKQYSKGPDAADGGKLVSAVYGQFPPHFQDELFSTEVGGATKPIINQYGYFVIKVISERQAPQGDFEALRPRLEQLATQQKQIGLSFDLSKGIREKYGFEMYDDNLKIVLNELPPDRDVLDPPVRDNEVYPLLDIDLQDLDKPVASYRDKVMTIKDFSDLYDRALFHQRPRRQFRLGSIRKFIIDNVMPELIEEEITTSGVENEPEVAKMLQRKKELMMVGRLYNDLVDEQTQVAWHEIQNYYDDNVEQFHSDEQRRFLLILTGDKKTAEKARQQVLDGGVFQRVAMDYATSEELERTGIHDRFLRPGQSPDLDPYGFALRDVGDITEPFEVTDGWVVARLAEKKPSGYIPISEASHEINHQLKQRKNEERLNQLLAKWRKEMQIEIYEDNVQKAELTGRATRQR
jgi:hypothetical protein